MSEELTGRFEVVQVARRPGVADRRLRAITSARILAAAHDLGLDLSPAAQKRLERELRAWRSLSPDQAVMAKRIEDFLRSEECAVQLPRAAGAPDPVPRAARALAALKDPADEKLVKQTIWVCSSPGCRAGPRRRRRRARARTTTRTRRRWPRSGHLGHRATGRAPPQAARCSAGRAYRAGGGRESWPGAPDLGCTAPCRPRCTIWAAPRRSAPRAGALLSAHRSTQPPPPARWGCRSTACPCCTAASRTA